MSTTGQVSKQTLLGIAIGITPSYQMSRADDNAPSWFLELVMGTLYAREIQLRLLTTLA